jgi:hypothetical protein
LATISSATWATIGAVMSGVKKDPGAIPDPGS